MNIVEVKSIDLVDEDGNELLSIDVEDGMREDYSEFFTEENIIKVEMKKSHN